MCNYMQTAPQEKEEMIVHKHSTFVVKAQQHTKRLLDTDDVEKRHMRQWFGHNYYTCFCIRQSE